MPDGATVPMWGYALEPDNDFTTLNGSVTVPGPVLTIPPGDGTLTIHLRNNGLPEPVSIVIPGQIADMEPFKLPDTHVPPRNRVHSFTAQTAPNSEHIYTWTNLKPGTYLYHSGTHPQIQVQMGLYGGIKHDAVAATGSTPAEAYTGVPFDAEAMLLYSEIDPALHTAVAGGTYGTPAYPSTINYAPKYFLVNGKPHEAGDPALPAGAVGQRTLIRFLNAGLQTVRQAKLVISCKVKVLAWNSKE
jgi:FtsP/CotA-like multicopper oxidase with cupredoxin domain